MPDARAVVGEVETQRRAIGGEREPSAREQSGDVAEEDERRDERGVAVQASPRFGERIDLPTMYNTRQAYGVLDRAEDAAATLVAQAARYAQTAAQSARAAFAFDRDSDP